MRYKLMAVDVDGTLLNSGSMLTEYTKEIIRLAVTKGLTFVISSGRPVQAVEPLLKELELEVDMPFIAYNGAMVVLGKSRQILYEQPLSSEDAKRIIELGVKKNTTVAMWSNNKLYASELNERAKQYSSISGVTPLLIDNVDELVKNGATKLLWYDEADVIKKYEKEVGQFLSPNVNFHTSRPVFLEFVDKRASKAIAMEKLGQHLGIDRTEMIAVGDGSNDLSMIEYAGLGIAMANAEDVVKEKAGYTTLSNDEDGVAYAIKKFFLEEGEL